MDSSHLRCFGDITAVCHRVYLVVPWRGVFA
jgi:hypothetical protein